MESANKEQQFTQALRIKTTSIGVKYRAIFELKSLNTIKSAVALMSIFNSLDDSELLKHEVAYALG